VKICGSWVAVPYREEYGWTTRVVCVREPHSAGWHTGRLGHRWRSGETPDAKNRPPRPC